MCAVRNLWVSPSAAPAGCRTGLRRGRTRGSLSSGRAYSHPLLVSLLPCRGVECSICSGAAAPERGPRSRSPSSHRRMLREVPQRPGPRPPEPRRVPGQPYPVLYITSEMSVKDFNPWNFFFLLPSPLPPPLLPQFVDCVEIVGVCNSIFQRILY